MGSKNVWKSRKVTIKSLEHMIKRNFFLYGFTVGLRNLLSLLLTTMSWIFKVFVVVETENGFSHKKNQGDDVCVVLLSQGCFCSFFLLWSQLSFAFAHTIQEGILDCFLLGRISIHLIQTNISKLHLESWHRPKVAPPVKGVYWMKIVNKMSLNKWCATLGYFCFLSTESIPFCDLNQNYFSIGFSYNIYTW